MQMQISRGLAYEQSTVCSILMIHTMILASTQENRRIIVQSRQSDLSVMIASRHFVIRDVLELISELTETSPGHVFRDQTREPDLVRFVDLIHAGSGRNTFADTRVRPFLNSPTHHI
jgi:hypothetical protein